MDQVLKYGEKGGHIFDDENHWANRLIFQQDGAPAKANIKFKMRNSLVKIWLWMDFGQSKCGHLDIQIFLLLTSSILSILESN